MERRSRIRRKPKSDDVSSLPKVHRQYHSEEQKQIRRHQLKVRRAVNREKKCLDPDCDNHRYDLSCYCHKHWKRWRRHGLAEGPLPTQGELRAIEGALRDWLEHDHLPTDFDKRAFKLAWASGQKLIRNHPSFALPFYRLEGDEGFTRQAKSWVILSHYFHRQQNSLSDAMLRLMAVRVWAEFYWRMPHGRQGVAKERAFFVHTWAGYFVLRNSGFSKTRTEEKIIGWQRPWYVSEDPAKNLPKPIKERVTKTVHLSSFKAGPIVREIGKELQVAVDHAMGTTWTSDPRLLARAENALGHHHNQDNSKE